jgi:putative ABC transport system permease protein
MLQTFLKLAWRHLLKSRTNSIINLLGLSLGMGVALLAGLWVWDECSFDHYHTNHDRLAQILSIDRINGAVGAGPYSSVPVAAELKSKFPKDFDRLSLLSATGETLIAGDKKLGQSGAWVQPDFPAMFSLRMIDGKAGALASPKAMLISASLAKALYGRTDVAGKELQVGKDNVFEVGGVYEDLPQNSSLSQYVFLLPWENAANPGKALRDDWSNHHFQLFVQIAQHTEFNRLSDKIKDLAKPHIPGGWEELQLYPMDRWRLYDRSENGQMTAGRLEQVWLCGLIGGLVLLLACINFMNLSTAGSEKRLRETGIRKVLGTTRGRLALQFLGEALLLTMMGAGVAILLTELSIPWFNRLTDKALAIPFSSPGFWLLSTGFCMLTGCIAGSYPAFHLSASRPVDVLKGQSTVGRFSALPRKILVVVQFTVSISLIIGVIMVYRQVRYSMDRPIGYSTAGLISMEPGMPGLADRFETLRQDLLQTGAIVEAAATSSPTTEVRNNMLGYDWEGRDANSMPAIGTLFVSTEFGRTIGWTIKQGRDFSRAFSTDTGASASDGAASPRSASRVNFAGSFIINEAAVKYMHLKDPLNTSIRWHGDSHPIVGVIRDMIMESPYKAAEPTFFTLTPNPRMRMVILRINPAIGMQTALAKIGTVMKRYDPVNPFYYSFVDQAYGDKFVDEERTGRLMTVFAALAVLISCMGLFALVAFVAGQRTREIGIRKVLGASERGLWLLLSGEFLWLVCIAVLLAAPLSGYFLHSWLQQYPYHTALSWWVFVSASAGALIITLCTISYQTLKAARANPVHSLRAS